MAAVTLISCKKRPFDYRNKYLGIYDFTVYQSSFDRRIGEVSGVLKYRGEITYGKEHSTILIHYLEDSFVELTLEKDGTLSERRVSGEFEDKKKIRFVMYSGGMGGGAFWEITGEKE